MSVCVSDRESERIIRREPERGERESKKKRWKV